MPKQTCRNGLFGYFANTRSLNVSGCLNTPKAHHVAHHRHRLYFRYPYVRYRPTLIGAHPDLFGVLDHSAHPVHFLGGHDAAAQPLGQATRKRRAKSAAPLVRQLKKNYNPRLAFLFKANFLCVQRTLFKPSPHFRIKGACHKFWRKCMP